MGFWNQLERVLVSVVDTAVECGRKKAQSSHLRQVIKKEAITVNRAYLTLGKHYYESLRGKAGDDAADHLCGAIDRSRERMKRARKRLVEINSSSVVVIGGADGPTAIFITSKERGSGTGVTGKPEAARDSEAADENEE